MTYVVVETATGLLLTDHDTVIVPRLGNPNPNPADAVELDAWKAANSGNL